jgi:hypothetical protein
LKMAFDFRNSQVGQVRRQLLQQSHNRLVPPGQTAGLIDHRCVVTFDVSGAWAE